MTFPTHETHANEPSVPDDASRCDTMQIQRNPDHRGLINRGLPGLYFYTVFPIALSGAQNKLHGFWSIYDLR